MFKLLKLFNDFKDYFIFVVLIVISLALISIDSKPNISGFRAAIIGTVGYVQNLFDWVPNVGALQNENKSLINLNVQLSSELALTRRALQENDGLRAMLDLQQNFEYNLIPVDVVNKSSIQMRNFATVNKGEKDGVRVGMAVSSEAGLVGSIIGTTNNFSMVELLNNRNVRISAILLESQAEGIIKWEGDEYLYFNNVPNSIEVKVGEIATTSLHSNKYPHNLTIGKVEKVIDEPGSHFSRIYIKPATSFFQFSQLFVVDFIQNKEELELLKQVEERIQLLEKRTR